MSGRRVQCAVLLLILLGSAVWACQVPVFRYALERWVSDPYRVQLLHRGVLPAEIQATIDTLATTPVNLEVRAYDLDALSEAEQWQIDDVPQGTTLPLLRLLPPPGEGQETILWEVPATTNAWATLIDSPLRVQVLREVMRGVSAVWVVIPGEDASATDAFEMVLRRDLAILQETLVLPEGVMHAGALKHADDRPDHPIDLDDVLRSHIPLTLDFAVIRVDPSDPREAASVAMLAPLAPKSGGVIPIFGRGRALPGMATEDYSIERLRVAAEYIVGSCSCQVKAENPGVDLVMHADWNAALNDQLIVSGRDLPPLEGVAVVRDEAERVGESSEADESMKESRHHLLRRNMVTALGLFFVFVIVAAFWSRRKSE